MVEKIPARLVTLAEKAWTAHQKDDMPPITELLWKPVDSADLQRCAYTISIKQPDNKIKCITFSTVPDTVWTTRFGGSLQKWPPGANAATQTFNRETLTHTDLEPATSADLQECREYLDTL